MRWMRRLGLLVIVLLTGPLLAVACGNVHFGRDWRTADRSSTGLAPDPATTPEAVVLVYAARAFNWRGVFAVHTWIATKPAGAERYTVHQVLGWRHWRGLPVIASGPDLPDRSWFGSEPRVLVELHGESAARALAGIRQAIADYPFADRYRLWPGPNSNTFTAWVGRRVPELGLELPPTAIGKDYLGAHLLAAAPSGTGFQLSAWGLVGVLAARREGLELNLLGMVFGLDPLGPALKLPGLGRIGLDDPWPHTVTD